MNKKSKIYVAGHRGMVGSSLMRLLQSRGYNNIITQTHSQLDLIRQADVEKYFEQEKPEYVFLAASKVGGILANNTYKAEFIYQNIMVAANVIDSAYKYGVKKLLNLGSSCIYPKLAEQPMKEEYLLSSSLEPTNEPYAVAKISALKMCRYYNEQYGTNFISVMPTNLYGPHDNFNLETAHVLPAFIRKFHLAKLLINDDFEGLKVDIKKYSLGFELDDKINFEQTESIVKTLAKLGIKRNSVTLWGSGKSYREFLHVDDLADACILLMLKFDYQHIGEILNVGTGVDLTIADLAKMVKYTVGYQGEIHQDSSKPDGPPRKLLEVDRIKKLGWQATIELEEGLKRTYEWYLRSLRGG
jgi:GDP-L-fucose synthase